MVLYKRKSSLKHHATTDRNSFPTYITVYNVSSKPQASETRIASSMMSWRGIRVYLILRLNTIAIKNQPNNHMTSLSNPLINIFLHMLVMLRSWRPQSIPEILIHVWISVRTTKSYYSTTYKIMKSLLRRQFHATIKVTQAALFIPKSHILPKHNLNTII